MLPILYLMCGCVLSLLILKRPDFIQVLTLSFVPFFTGAVFLDVCDAAGLPPEGVVDVDLGVAALEVVEVVLGLAVLDAAVEFLVALAE